MHPRVEQLPPPAPDAGRFLQVLRRERPDRVPLIELSIHPQVVNEVLGLEPVTGADAAARQAETTRRLVAAYHVLGHDVVKVSAPIPFLVQRLQAGGDASARQWTDEHAGPIADLDDFEAYEWPTAADADFRPIETAEQHLPAGMQILGFCGGVLEFGMDLVGMQRFMLATRRDPELIARVVERVGEVIYGVFERYCQRESVAALWLGDDLGHKHGLLISPKVLTEHVFPWYRQFVELAHQHGKPFILHSCGNTRTIMPQLVDEVGIDAKHSFEDLVWPVEEYYGEYHDRVAVLGGIDVHLLSVGTDDEIKTRTLQVLEQCAIGGGYACGSGNSIPDYVPTVNYVALIEAVNAFNGR